MLVTDLFRRAAQAWPDQTFLHCDGHQYTFVQLWNQSVAVASWLAERHVRPGDRVILCGRNCAEYVAALVGTLLRGAVAVPLCYKLGDGKLTALVRDAAPAAVAADGAQLNRIRGELEAAEAAVLQLRGSGPPSGVAELADLSSGLPRDDDLNHSGAPAVMVYRGTNGRTRAVAFSHKNLVAAVAPILAEVAIHRTDRTRLTLPLHQSGGLAALLAHAAMGAELILACDGTPAANSEAWDSTTALWTDHDGLEAHLGHNRGLGGLDYVACWGLLPPGLHRRAIESLGHSELIGVYWHPEAAGPLAFQCEPASTPDGIPCRLATGLRLSLDDNGPAYPRLDKFERLAFVGPTVAEWTWKNGRYIRRTEYVTTEDRGTLTDDGILYVLEAHPSVDDEAAPAARA